MVLRLATSVKLNLSQEDPRRVEMLLNIEEGTPITVSTAATLISQGITGNTYVGFQQIPLI